VADAVLADPFGECGLIEPDVERSIFEGVVARVMERTRPAFTLRTVMYLHELTTNLRAEVGFGGVDNHQVN